MLILLPGHLQIAFESGGGQVKLGDKKEEIDRESEGFVLYGAEVEFGRHDCTVCNV